MKFEVDQDKKSAHLTLKAEHRNPSDFAILYRSKEISKSKLYIQTSSKQPKEIAALISFFPDFNPPIEDESETNVDVSRERQYENLKEEQDFEAVGQFVFMLDRSCSMKGKRMEMAKEAAKLFIKSLPKGSKFNIISYGSHFEQIFQGSTMLTQESVNRAISLISQFQADMGGTQIYPPLQYIYNCKRDPNYPLIIFLITDGAVNYPDAVVNLISQNTKSARCHCFGIGSSVNKEVIKKASLAGKGSYNFIRDKDLSSLNARVIGSLSRAIKPGLINLQLNYTSKDHVILQGRKSIPDAFHGEAQHYYAILDQSYPKGAPIMISAFQSRSMKRIQFEMNLDNAYKLPEGEELLQICAQSAIQQGILKSSEQKDISLKYKVPSSQTMIVGENGNEVWNVNTLTQRKQKGLENTEKGGIAFKLHGKKRKMMEREEILDSPIPQKVEESKVNNTSSLKEKVNEETKEQQVSERLQTPKEARRGENPTMEKIIELQTVQGTWEPNQELFQLTLQTGRELSQKPPQKFHSKLKRDLAWSTLVGVWLLQSCYPKRENEWKLVVHKGRKALQELGVDIKTSLSLL